MGLENYGKIEKGRHKKIRRRITGGIIAAVLLIICVGIIGLLAGNNEGYRRSVSSIEENHELKARIAELEEQVGELQAQIAERDELIAAIPTPAPTPYEPAVTAIPDASQQGMTALEPPRQ